MDSRRDEFRADLDSRLSAERVDRDDSRRELDWRLSGEGSSRVRGEQQPAQSMSAPQQDQALASESQKADLRLSAEDIARLRQKAAVRRQLAGVARETLKMTSSAALSAADITALIARIGQDQETSLADRVAPEAWNQILVDLPHQLDAAGLLGPLLRDKSIVEIMVNGPDCLLIERVGGQIERWREVFIDEEEITATVNAMLAHTGRRLSEESPLIDGRLPDGSRLHGVHADLSQQGTCITIRKFQELLTMDSLLHNGTLDARIARFLRACVLSKQNLLISGGSGTGKTTLLSILCQQIPEQERVVAVESVSEIIFDLPNAINLETRLPSEGGKGEISPRELIRNALRMRPSRIVVGEVRGGEALELLQVMNTGHPGSMGTIHSSSARDALIRMQTSTLLAGIDLPMLFVCHLVSEAVDFVVHLKRDADGVRRVTAVEEVLGLEGETIVTQTLFKWEAGLDESGRHIAMGIPPRRLGEMEEVEDLHHSLFREEV
jgi:pilus assembly protein CpaF